MAGFESLVCCRPSRRSSSAARKTRHRRSRPVGALSGTIGEDDDARERAGLRGGLSSQYGLIGDQKETGAGDSRSALLYVSSAFVT